jgi:succinate dehydrogenase / fumarate reductase membrane anchor subunit
MTQANSGPKPGEGAWLWLAKIVSGALIFVVLAIHLTVNHMAEEGLLSHADVVAYYQNPLIILMEAFFLVFVVVHSLTGLRGILLDLNPRPGLMRMADAALLVLGSVSIVYGIWLLQAVMALGAS